MTQAEAPTYTIAEAAALTGLHKNTIRMRVKLGQIPALRTAGKYGEEYRITESALVSAGLLTPPEIPTPSVDAAQPLTTTTATAAEIPPMASQTALLDLFQRHEHSMFRLGYLEAEMVRQKGLAENAESLQTIAREREQENRELRRELERAQERVREIEELRVLVRDMERDTERMREDVERYRAAAARPWWQMLFGRRLGG